jgi:hypothetical protein
MESSPMAERKRMMATPSRYPVWCVTQIASWQVGQEGRSTSAYS